MTNAAANADAAHVFSDQLNPGSIERLDDFGRSIDDAPDIALAGLHPPDRWQRHAGGFSELALIDPQ